MAAAVGAAAWDDKDETSTVEQPNAAEDEPMYTTDYNSMKPAEKRMFLGMYNSGVRPSEAARRATVERGSLRPMAMDR